MEIEFLLYCGYLCDSNVELGAFLHSENYNMYFVWSCKKGMLAAEQEGPGDGQSGNGQLRDFVNPIDKFFCFKSKEGDGMQTLLYSYVHTVSGLGCKTNSGLLLSPRGSYAPQGEGVYKGGLITFPTNPGT
eukprot:8590367-Ditylum_brightwellii.AAC.1